VGYSHSILRPDGPRHLCAKHIRRTQARHARANTLLMYTRVLSMSTALMRCPSPLGRLCPSPAPTPPHCAPPPNHGNSASADAPSRTPPGPAVRPTWRHHQHLIRARRRVALADPSCAAATVAARAWRAAAARAATRRHQHQLIRTRHPRAVVVELRNAAADATAAAAAAAAAELRCHDCAQGSRGRRVGTLQAATACGPGGPPFAGYMN
jgi:hypothetical protein